MAPNVKPTSRIRSYDTYRTPALRDTFALKPHNPTGVTKTPHRRRKKTYPKILGPVNPQYGSSSNAESRLLSLPQEIRHKIWGHALTVPDKHLHYDTAALRFDFSQLGTGLFATCHQIALETMYMPLKLNRLCFDVQGFLIWRRRLAQVEGKLGWEIKVANTVCVRQEQDRN